MPLQIQISAFTVAKLKELKHPGQTWDGIIRELIEGYEWYVNPAKKEVKSK